MSFISGLHYFFKYKACIVKASMTQENSGELFPFASFINLYNIVIEKYDTDHPAPTDEFVKSQSKEDKLEDVD